jgi:hypothetical protein
VIQKKKKKKKKKRCFKKKKKKILLIIDVQGQRYILEKKLLIGGRVEKEID